MKKQVFGPNTGISLLQASEIIRVKIHKNRNKNELRNLIMPLLLEQLLVVITGAINTIAAKQSHEALNCIG